MDNPKGRADYLELGDYNAVCYECGRKRKASMLRRHWQGYYVCPEHWEARHPQDFVRGVQDIQTPPWTQPMPADQFVYTCTLETVSATPGLAGPGCAIPSRPYISF